MSERICWYCKEPIEEGYFRVIKKEAGLIDAHKECHQKSQRSKCNLHIKIRPGRGSVGGLGR